MVFFHTRNKGKFNWHNVRLHFKQIPSVGEYVLFEQEWHKVELVIHIPKEEDSEFTAEVFAVRCKELEAMSKLDYNTKEESEMIQKVNVELQNPKDVLVNENISEQIQNAIKTEGNVQFLTPEEIKALEERDKK